MCPRIRQLLVLFVLLPRFVVQSSGHQPPQENRTPGTNDLPARAGSSMADWTDEMIEKFRSRRDFQNSHCRAQGLQEPGASGSEYRTQQGATLMDRLGLYLDALFQLDLVSVRGAYFSTRPHCFVTRLDCCERFFWGIDRK